MKCARYKLKNNTEFLAYALESENSEFPNMWGVELLEENVDPKTYPDLQVIHIPETWIFRKRTRDKRLESEGILSYSDLANAYNLIKIKSLNKPASIRTAVLEKYADIMEFVNFETNGQGTDEERTGCSAGNDIQSD